ncbi:MAG: TldD/PmbA family protein [Desulfurococcaceae archaeon]
MKDVLMNIFEKTVSKSRNKGLDEVEFYGEWIRSLNIDISRDKVKSMKSSFNVTYGIHGCIGKRIGSIGSRNLEADLDTLLEKLVSIAKSNPEDPYFPGFAKGYSRGFEPKTVDKRLVDIDSEYVLEILNNAMSSSRESALKNGAEEVIVSEGGLRIDNYGVLIGNSNGETLYHEYTLFDIGYTVKSRAGGEESSFTMMVSNRMLDESEVMKEAVRAGEYSVKFMKAKPVESGTYRVLLDHYMTALFVATALQPAFSAHEVQENRSPLKGRIGQEVLSGSITIVDDPFIDYGIGSRSFDDEGIRCSKKAVVEKGVLKTILYNYYTASRDRTLSTGNAIRANPGVLTRPGFTNLVIQPLSNLSSFDEMASSGRVLVVHGMIGYWMSNYVNGLTQATVSHGLLYVNGEVKQAVKNVVIGGNIYDWMGSSLLALSKDVVKVSNIYTPALLIENVRVAG